MANFQNKIDEMQRKLNMINDDIEEISFNQKNLYQKKKPTNNINYSTTEKSQSSKLISTKHNRTNNNSLNFFRVNSINKNIQNNLQTQTKSKIAYKKGICNLKKNENNLNEKPRISNYVNKSYYMNQNNKKFPINITTKDEDLPKETKKILGYNKLKQTYNDFFPHKKLSYNYNYPTRNYKNNNNCLNINSLTAKNKDFHFLKNCLSSDSNKIVYSQRETDINKNNINGNYNDVRPSISSYNLNIQEFRNEFENQKKPNGNIIKNRANNYCNSKIYEYFLNNEENKKLHKKDLSAVNMKISKLNEVNNSQIISDIIEITSEYTNKGNKINTDNILDEYKKILREIKVKNEFIFKMMQFYNKETKSNININDPESLLIIWNWINKRKLEEEKRKKEDEEYRKICQDIMKEYKIKNINQLKLHIQKLCKSLDKNENFLEGIKKILLP